MATKITKKQLEAKIKELEEFNSKLTDTIRQLLEENGMLKGKLAVYESIPKTVADCGIFCLDMLTGNKKK